MNLVYDARGTPCPLAFVQFKLQLRRLPFGQSLIVYADDRASYTDMVRYLAQQERRFSVQRCQAYWQITVNNGN